MQDHTAAKAAGLAGRTRPATPADGTFHPMPGKPSRLRHDGGGVQTIWASCEDPMKIMALRSLISPASTPILPQHRPP
jgi:hypothetical protein